MPPLPQVSPKKEVLSQAGLPHEAANDNHFFDDGACVHVLSAEDALALFKKRRATEWMIHNRTDGDSQKTYKNENERILEEMKRYNLSEADYEKYLKNEGIMID